MRWKIAGFAAAIVFAAGAILFVLHQGKQPPSVVLPMLPPEQILATYENRFRCTFYYTPRESGFTPERGFNVSPATREGLKGHEFPHDFLLAVEKEGFGRLKKPINGQLYIRYSGGTWGFAEKPIDRNQHPLIARQSCAICAKPGPLAPEARLKIQARAPLPELEKLRWIVADTGSGLEEDQLDLYWGEDDPMGPGKQLSRPKSVTVDLADVTVSVIR